MSEPRARSLQMSRFSRRSKPGAWFGCFFFPGWSQVKLPLNSRIEVCCAAGMEDDPHPEVEEMHSSRIEDCDPEAHGFVAFLKIPSRPIREGSSLVEGRASPSRNRVSGLIHTYVEISTYTPKSRYLWMSSKPILQKISFLILFSTGLLS